MINKFKKQRFYQKLDTRTVYLVDNTPLSDNYFAVSDLPTKLVAGKNSFKIQVNNKYLQNGSNVLFEVIDQNKNVIYSETSEYTDRNGKKIITIYIYPDTSISIAQITLIGVATKNVLSKPYTDIPAIWKDRYNLKWTYKVSIDPLYRNNNEILLDHAPIITAKEIFKQQNYHDYTHNSNIENRIQNITIYSSSYGYSASYKSIINSTQTAFNYNQELSNYTRYSNGINSTYETNSSDLINSDASQYKTIFNRTNNGKSEIIQSVNEFYYDDTSYPVLTLYSQSAIPSGYEFEFKNYMIGGVINIYNPNNLIPDYTNYYLSTTDEIYSATIVNVLNRNQIQVATPYKRTIKDSNNKIQDVYFKQFGNSQFYVTYSSDYSITNSEARKNYAEITISDLNLISGDIYRIKPYVKSVTDASDFIPQTDIIINSNNILISTSSIKYEEPLGIFQSQNFIDSYWDVSNESDASTITAEYNNDVLLNGMHISSSTPITTGYIGISQITSTYFNLYANNYYEISLNISGERNSIIDNHDFNLIGFGNAFDTDFPAILPIGTLIGKIHIPTNTNKINYRKLTFGFTPNRTGIGAIAFSIHGGEWNISDVEVKSVKLPGFTPSQIKFIVPLQPIWDNDILDLKFELYNYKGEMANQILHLNNVKFEHGYSHYIQGQYNLITGSAWLGKELNTGIELTGKHSGIVKSCGYDGWNAANAGTGDPGFIMWSGSFILTNPLGGDPTTYSGVGIELHGGIHPDTGSHALHFDTVTGQLQVTGSIIATDAVFNNYAIADYIGSRIVTVDNTTKNDYCKNYSSHSVSWSYLDLSGVSTESAMFVRFETKPDYPITHIQIPEMYSFNDNEVGGTITLEFDSALPPMYFKNQPEMAGMTYSPQLPLLNASNAIRNYAGGFTYMGFNTLSGSGYINMLPSRAGARYLFTKGLDGYGLTSCTNYDEILMTYKDVALLNQHGTRRNQFIQPKDVNTNMLITGSFTPATESWNGFNYYMVSSSESEDFGAFTYQVIKSLNFKYIVPEFILNSTGSIFHYFSVNNVGSIPHSIKLFSQSYSSYNHDITLSNITFNNYSQSCEIDDVTISSINTINLIGNNKIQITGSKSGDVIDYNFCIGYLNYNYVNYLGSRISFDYDTNFGGFNNAIPKPPPEPI